MLTMGMLKVVETSGTLRVVLNELMVGALNVVGMFEMVRVVEKPVTVTPGVEMAALVFSLVVEAIIGSEAETEPLTEWLGTETIGKVVAVAA